LLRDDIHQSELGYRLYAELIGSHIVEFLSSVNITGRAVPSYWKTAQVTAVNKSLATKNSITAMLTVSGFANGTAVLNLPRWCRPDRDLTFPCVFTTSGGAYAAATAYYTNGAIYLTGLTQADADIVLDIRW
jgi:hypothetical protein